jgi:hypothetical protein
MNHKHFAVIIAALLPLAAHAGPRSELSTDLEDARKEIRTELAQERLRLENENLSLGDTFHVGGHDRRTTDTAAKQPKGEITPAGDLLVDGKAIQLDAAQRKQLLGYRTQVIGLARDGIDAGEKAALLAIDATDVSLFNLIVGGLTGSLERRVKSTVQRELQPAILQICHRLPQLRESQQSLAGTVPAFRPYATLRSEDVASCEADVRRDLAAR